MEGVTICPTTACLIFNKKYPTKIRCTCALVYNVDVPGIFIVDPSNLNKINNQPQLVAKKIHKKCTINRARIFNLNSIINQDQIILNSGKVFIHTYNDLDIFIKMEEEYINADKNKTTFIN